MNLQGSDGGSSVEDKTTQFMEDVRMVRKAELDVIYYLPSAFQGISAAPD